MYYHVLIDVAGNKAKDNKTIRKIDITDKEALIEELISPYVSNEEIMFNGYILLRKNITRLLVKASNRSAHEIANEARQESYQRGCALIIVSDEDMITYSEEMQDITSELIKEVKQCSTAKRQTIIPSRDIADRSKVFIVHGRENSTKLEVARFIERLGFVPIILNEQPNEGMTIIEKIEKYSDVGYGVVLYTPCDIGYMKDDESNKKYRARQNVVFEHGYLVAKLGRENVTTLVRSGVETPNDISGVVYIDFDEKGAWKFDLARNLKNAGYDVDMNLLC